MSGTLYVVATPIGNLEDITLRALRVLREASVIAAEDTRRTARLLAHHAIQTPTVSFHDHNVRTRVPQLLGRLRSGESVALVTDAGTPGVSDPGIEMVAACVEAGIPVDPIPGVSAPLTAAVASGFPLEPLTILGFAPSRSKDRMAFLSAVNGYDHTVTFFETPHRIAGTLADASAVLGKRPIVVGRELTKMHQEFLRGTPQDILDRLGAPKGEFTIVVGPRLPSEGPTELPSDALVAREFGLMTDDRVGSRREAVAAVAKKYGRPTKEVYAAIERAKKSGI
jgi:16S rRNA (cytidine1402-2'-O)-methyltransferase